MENIERIRTFFDKDGVLFQNGLVSILIVVIAVVAGGILSKTFLVILRKMQKQTPSVIASSVLSPDQWRAPSYLFFIALCITLAFPLLYLPGNIQQVVKHFLGLWIIVTFTFMSIRIVSLIREIMLQQYDLSDGDNIKARAVHTRVKVIERIVIFTIIVIAVASMLMTFDKVRQVGISLLASAGIVGVVVGFAAQRSIATIIAGVQIAITQPIRIDDVVIVENEWGRIEEITLTYAVVRIWDQRRLIVPITWFIEKPFQNWTRTSSQLLATVFVYVDYTVPFETVRKELRHICDANPLWDKRVCVLQVTNSSDRCVEMRALVSAEDSSKAWELRCSVREKLIGFLQKKYPWSLPRVRFEMETRLTEPGLVIEKG